MRNNALPRTPAKEVMDFIVSECDAIADKFLRFPVSKREIKKCNVKLNRAIGGVAPAYVRPKRKHNANKARLLRFLQSPPILPPHTP